MPTKSFHAKVKATGEDAGTGLSDGQFTALASVFGNVDAVGDVVLPGAFADDLKAWKDSGDVIPLYWAHRMDDPGMCIGHVLDAQESDAGLEVKAQLDLDTANGAQVYRLMKGRRVNRMSFAYDIEEGGPAKHDDVEVYELRRLKLHEVSVVQVPANPEAVVQTVKAGASKVSNARRSARRAALKQAVEDNELAGLLGQVDQAIDDAAESLDTADAAMDAVLAALGIPDADDAEESAEGEAGGDPQAPKEGAAHAKSGRALSAKNEERVRQIARLAKELLDAVDAESSTEDDGKASPARSAATEEPDGAKVDVPAARLGPASLRLLADLAAIDADTGVTTELTN